MRMPIDPGKVKKVADKIQREIDLNFALDIFVDKTCNPKFIDSIKTYFSAAEDNVTINFKDASARPIYFSPNLAFAVILAGSDASCAKIYDKLNSNGALKIVLCSEPAALIQNFDDASISYNKNDIVCPDVNTYSRDEEDETLINFDDYNEYMDLSIKEKLSDWIYAVSETMELAYAEMFPFLRERIANNLIYTCSLENGGIGFIKIIPGADMPLMTLNQVRMLLQLAAIYGYKINEDRVLEIVTLVAAAFGMRYLSNFVKSNSPIPKFIVDGSFGVSATVVLGNIAKEYFASGYAIDGLVDKCKTFFLK